MLRRVLLAVALAAGASTGTVAHAWPMNGPTATSVMFVEPPECPYQGQHAPIRPGMSGPAVRHLQCVLNRVWGYAVPIDGVVGPSTVRAVVTHQANCHIPADGVVGRLTWDALHPATAPAECWTEG